MLKEGCAHSPRKQDYESEMDCVQNNKQKEERPFNGREPACKTRARQDEQAGRGECQHECRTRATRRDSEQEVDGLQRHGQRS